MGREDGLRRRVDLGQLVDERGGDERLEGVVADAVDEFLASDLKVSALGSVRGRKVLVDDGQG